ncbi:MAG: hypothetical protein COB60_12535 [Flavobacteriaceae bacterium]|nr:MAG: hypothetical protein COB60_12535 [Flavobacteriaceae bacterium]
MLLKLADHPKIKNHTFITIQKHSKRFRVGERLTIQDYGGHFQKYGLIKHIQTISQNEITPQLSFLDKDCDIQTHLECLKLDKFYEPDGKYDVLTISETKEIW